MRRALPWLATALLVVLAGAAGVFGVPGLPRRSTAPASKEPSGYPPEPVEHVSLVETLTLSQTYGTEDVKDLLIGESSVGVLPT